MQTENQRFYYQDYSRDIIQSMCWVKPNQEAEWQERMSLGARELSKQGTLRVSSQPGTSSVCLTTK